MHYSLLQSLKACQHDIWIALYILRGFCCGADWEYSVLLQNKYFSADALGIDHDRKVVTCNDGMSQDNFEVKYDKLAIATGSQGSTFGIPGKPCAACLSMSAYQLAVLTAAGQQAVLLALSCKACAEVTVICRGKMTRQGRHCRHMRSLIYGCACVTCDVRQACPYRSGVEDRTHFLRDVAHSAAIRKHLIGNWNKANLPSAQHPLAACSVRSSQAHALQRSCMSRGLAGRAAGISYK